MRREEVEIVAVDAMEAGGTGDDGRLVLTVEEAARMLRIGRSAAYEQARRYIASGGVEGLPVLRMGRALRVPRHALVRLLGL
jgi:hypothetical protein